MSAVREAALRDDYLVRAVDAPYDLRDKLKQRGYRWRSPDLPNGKVWWTMASNSEAEITWLQADVYGRKAEVPVHEITPLVAMMQPAHLRKCHELSSASCVHER